MYLHPKQCEAIRDHSVTTSYLSRYYIDTPPMKTITILINIYILLYYVKRLD